MLVLGMDVESKILIGLTLYIQHFIVLVLGMDVESKRVIQTYNLIPKVENDCRFNSLYTAFHRVGVGHGCRKQKSNSDI